MTKTIVTAVGLGSLLLSALAMFLRADDKPARPPGNLRPSLLRNG